MRRRDFITLLGGAATWPVAARAQKPEQMRRVSVLVGLDEKDAEAQRRAKAFRLGMRDLGWIEGRNVQIEIRFTESNLESINKHVAEVTRLAPDIVVANSTPVIAALRATKSTIPIVFAMVNDPVGQGFISSLAHPGANITGFYFIDFEMVGKWINLLGDVKPSLSQVALMFNPGTSAYFDDFLRSFKMLQQSTPVEVQAIHVRSAAEVEAAIARLGRNPGCGLIYRQFVVDGSLISYGPDTADIFRRSSSYVDRILKGEPPSNLPAQAPSKFELVFNLNTAKALGLSVRSSFLQLADEVIE
ncbi:MAG: ABC transporter substrate-binding protein [Pseudolabrys sp.]|jgi:putative ABC transport system substrate-binding protein